MALIETITAKFGGSSLADAARMRAAIRIVSTEPLRRYVVVSAPGKRDAGDTKMTDRLLALPGLGVPERRRALAEIEERYLALKQGLNLDIDLSADFEDLRALAHQEELGDYLASRGEYLSARIMSAALQFPFVDAACFVRMDAKGAYDAAATEAMLPGMIGQQAVIPGFYGRGPDGSIRTFARGGSDITGAIVASVTRSAAYENWTDTNGVYTADPRIVENPVPLASLSRDELQELGYRGAGVFHWQSFAPLRGTSIEVAVRNTGNPGHPGTRITESVESDRATGPIAGIARRIGFTAITVQRDGMNEETGALYGLVRILYELGVSIDHVATSLNAVTFVAEDRFVSQAGRMLAGRIEALGSGTEVRIEPGIAMLCVVGDLSAHRHAIPAKLFGALAGAGIAHRTIDQGANERALIVGVQASRADDAVRAAHRAFFG